MTIDLIEWREAVTTAAGSAVDAAGTMVFDHPDAVTIAAILGVVVAAHRWWPRRKKDTQGEQDEMKRRVQLESTYADKIHDFMLDLLTKGVITRKEYKRDCRRFGVAFRLFDLLRPMRSKNGIKHKVRRNVAANHATLQFIQAEKIPGPKPGEVPALPSKPKRKAWVAVGKRHKVA